MGDGLLYVQPLYTLRKEGEGRYPVLRFVLVSFGEQVGIGTTLTSALDDVLGLTPGSTENGGGAAGAGSGGAGGSGGGGAVSSDVRALLTQAEAKFAAAQKALQSGDLQGYAKAQSEAATWCARRSRPRGDDAEPVGLPSPAG